MLFLVISPVILKPDQILLLQPRNCGLDRCGSQSSLFANFRRGQLTFMLENLKDDEVAHGDSFCRYSTLKKIS